MKLETHFKTEHIKFSQQILLFLSILIFILFLYYLVYEFSKSMLILFLIALPILFFVNYFQRHFYDISIENDSILLDNIWGKKTIPLSLLRDIKQYEFILPLLANPFLQFKVEGQGKIITQVPFIIREYLKAGGINAYIKKLKEELICENYI